jgi:2-polyprenyl-3-methyl-5-hydroxy-6-metoxy-1,4-benzoquinol methylase
MIRPMNPIQEASHTNLPQIFEQAYYQRLYDIERTHGWARGMRRIMESLLDNHIKTDTPLRILDVGCGTGYLMNQLRQQYSKGAPVVGLDISLHALHFCQQSGEQAVLLASAVDLPFESGSFDLIICIDTIQHLFPENADNIAIREFARLLSPGGILYLRTNSALGHIPLKGVDARLYRRYKLGTVITMLQENGFEIEQASYLNAIPGLWGMIKESLTLRRKETAPIGPGLAIKPYSPAFAWLNPIMYGILALEAWLVGKTGIRLPFGHSSVYLARLADQTKIAR